MKSKASIYFQRYQRFIDSHPAFVWGSIAVYLLALVIGMLWLNLSMTPDRLALALFVLAILLGQALRFLRDWVPFIGIVFAYESLRGFADNLRHDQINITSLIDADRWLAMGQVPTIYLQERLHTAGVVQWYDWVGTILYFLHFPLPLFLAFYLWRTQIVRYWEFVISFSILCLSGFVTYVLYPAAPPWWAAREGYLPPVIKIMDQVLALFPERMSISYLYANLNPNPVAAMPSLHSAFPWLVFLMLWQLFGKRSLYFLPYCLALWFSIVYMGEHYIIDVVAGVIYASVSFWAGTRVVRWFVRKRGLQLAETA